MLVRCPKCDFQQPEDQYCANCGIDMKQYTPSSGNHRRSKSGNTLTLQAFALIALAIGGSIWYFNHQNQELTDRSGPMATQRRLLNPGSSAPAPSHQKIQVTTLNDEQKDSLVGVDNSASSAENSEQSFSSRTISPTSTESIATTETKENRANSALFTLNYYEIPKTLVDFWIQKSAAEHPEYNQTGVSYGLLFKEELSKLSQARLLLSEKTKMNVGQNFELVHTSSTYQNPRENPSLTLNISYTGLTSDLAALQIDVLKRLPSPENLPGVKIEIPKNSAAFILWRNLVNGFQNHPELLQIAPFNFITSPKANSRETELVLVIESYF